MKTISTILMGFVLFAASTVSAEFPTWSIADVVLKNGQCMVGDTLVVLAEDNATAEVLWTPNANALALVKDAVVLHDSESLGEVDDVSEESEDETADGDVLTFSKSQFRLTLLGLFALGALIGGVLCYHIGRRSAWREIYSGIPGIPSDEESQSFRTIRTAEELARAINDAPNDSPVRVMVEGENPIAAILSFMGAPPELLDPKYNLDFSMRIILGTKEQIEFLKAEVGTLHETIRNLKAAPDLLERVLSESDLPQMEKWLEDLDLLLATAVTYLAELEGLLEGSFDKIEAFLEERGCFHFGEMISRSRLLLKMFRDKQAGMLHQDIFPPREEATEEELHDEAAALNEAAHGPMPENVAVEATQGGGDKSAGK